jgi:hypothetical protein
MSSSSGKAASAAGVACSAAAPRAGANEFLRRAFVAGAAGVDLGTHHSFTFVGKNRLRRFFRDPTHFPAAKSVVFAAYPSA